MLAGLIILLHLLVVAGRLIGKLAHQVAAFDLFVAVSDVYETCFIFDLFVVVVVLIIFFD